MKTYTVWFKDYADNGCVFVSGVPGEKLAENIASNLVDEGFTDSAWVEEG